MRFLLTLSLAGVLALTSCSTSTTTANTERRVTTSADLERLIKDRLAADPQLSARKVDVDADAEKNQVTLKGTVPSEQLRLRAVELAKAARNGVAVVDKIDVKPTSVPHGRPRGRCRSASCRRTAQQDRKPGRD